MSKTKIDNIMRDFLLGIIRLHILHHAQQEPVFGLELIRELATHGYELSPGTLYPILHSLEAHGFLESTKEVVNGKARKVYRATAAGAEALEMGRAQVLELLEEIGLNPMSPQQDGAAIQ